MLHHSALEFNFLSPIRNNKRKKETKPCFFLYLDSSSSSSCSTPNDCSIVRALSDINSLLLAVGLGKKPAAQTCLSTSSSTSSSTVATPKASVQSPILRSTSEINQLSASARTTPSPQLKRQHKRTCSSPIAHTIKQINDSPKTNYRSRPSYPPIRPDSLAFSFIPPPPPPSSSSSNHSLSTAITSTPEEDEDFDDDDDGDYEKFYSAHSSKISTPMVQPLTVANRSNIIDIETDEQKKPSNESPITKS